MRETRTDKGELELWGTVVRIVREFRRPRGVALVKLDDGMKAEVWEKKFPSMTFKEGMRVKCKVRRTATMIWENKVTGISQLSNDNEPESIWASV
jgi:hypothetical protein